MYAEEFLNSHEHYHEVSLPEDYLPARVQPVEADYDHHMDYLKDLTTWPTDNGYIASTVTLNPRAESVCAIDGCNVDYGGFTGCRGNCGGRYCGQHCPGDMCVTCSPPKPHLATQLMNTNQFFRIGETVFTRPAGQQAFNYNYQADRHAHIRDDEADSDDATMGTGDGVVPVRNHSAPGDTIFSMCYVPKGQMIQPRFKKDVCFIKGCDIFGAICGCRGPCGERLCGYHMPTDVCDGCLSEL